MRSSRERYATAGETSDYIATLFLAYYEELYDYANRRTGDWALAEDLVQSTMETAQKNVDKVKGSKSAKGWLLKTLNFKLQREMRKTYHGREYLVEEPENELPMDHYKQRSGLTLEGLDELLPPSCPVHMREILCLRYVEQLQYREIGNTLGISPSAVQQRLLCAYRWLKDYFERHGMPRGE